MFFILSKIFLFLLSPTFWVIFFLVAGFFIKRKRLKKWCFGLAIGTFIAFSNPFLLNRFARYWDAPEVEMPLDAHYSAAILLGGFASEDFHGHGYFNSTADRFIQALKLKMNGTVSHILISGGSADLLPTDFRESNWVTKQLHEFQIPDSAILTENRARNSLENAAYSKQILDSLRLPPPYVLVTSAFHMRRALLTFRKMNVEVIPYPSNYIAGMNKTEFGDFIPSFGVLGTWEYYLKEVVGYWVYYFKKVSPST